LVDITRTEWYHKMKDKMTPGKRILVYRDIMGLTQKQLGKKLGENRKKISDYENDRRGISKNFPWNCRNYLTCRCIISCELINTDN
jgi:DNA-binding XRE family transcriptional regulator